MTLMLRVALILLASSCFAKAQSQEDRLSFAGHVIALNMELLEVLPAKSAPAKPLAPSSRSEQTARIRPCHAGTACGRSSAR
jgi:hypothetical protein